MSPPLEAIAEAVGRDGGAFAAALRAPADRDSRTPWAPLCGTRFANGVEAIYEGYLLHRGRSRLFAPPSDEDALLLGDELYALGLVWVAEADDTEAIAALSDLIALTSRTPAGAGDDDELWRATAAFLADRALAPQLVEAQQQSRAGA